MRHRNSLFLLLLFSALLPYGILCFYALPFADDFCFGWTASENIPFLQKFLKQYLNWNGRYTSDVLVNFHPITDGRLWVGQLTLLVSLLCTPVVLFVLLLQLTQEKFIAVFTSLAVTLLYLCYLPNLTEGVYWFIGIANYHVGSLTLLLHVAAQLKTERSTGKARMLWQALAALLLIAAIGFNEIGALIIPAAYLLVVLVQYKNKIEQRSTYTALLALAVVASGFVIFSPGNFVRESEFAGQHQFFRSVFYALLQTVRFTGKWLLNYPAIAFATLLVMHAHQLPLKRNITADWRLPVVLGLFIVFTAAFVPYYATGMLGQHRTMNYVYPFFLLLCALGLYWFTQQQAGRNKLASLHSNQLSTFLVVTAFAASFFTGNGWLITKEVTQPKYSAYRQEFLQRHAAMKQHPGAAYALTQVPAVFTITDAQTDSTYWVNRCMYKFYTETDIELR
jgi:hypothetical protein